MSAVPPIASELVRCSDSTKSATADIHHRIAPQVNDINSPEPQVLSPQFLE